MELNLFCKAKCLLNLLCLVRGGNTNSVTEERIEQKNQTIMLPEFDNSNEVMPQHGIQDWYCRDQHEQACPGWVSKYGCDKHGISNLCQRTCGRCGGVGVIRECSNEMTNKQRMSCKLPCETTGGVWGESFYNFGAVAYDYTDPRIVHMGKEGVKAGLVRLPSRQSFRMYFGKVLLVVPVASFCTQTRQYIALNELRDRFRHQPFEILGFPCNQFAKLEPGLNASEISQTLRYVRPGMQQWVQDKGYLNGFIPSFPIMERADVNGENQMPVFKFLKSRCPSPMKEYFSLKKLFWEPFHEDDIRWVFEKFLINKQGRPVMRYGLLTRPEDMVADIEDLLRYQ